ncbi:rhodanese-like domain-containing protein [Desulfobacula toluolica]|uniref:Rhodanese domain protein n=1 Tax=Desulfobacula toluolica (strain DSM 7467 / Tol2) TaxID=651182 RepID=K0N906_DESTT|nr:rhodanese-like domain-containing protein [Desulfobacula toluolica]CCK80419.1 rhodanese domain protein [Desulfobacula toluolica Tol2]
MIRKDLTGALIIVLGALVTAFSYNYFSPSGIALFGQWETSKGVVSAASKTGSVNNSIEITSSDIIWQMVQKKERVVLDVRPHEIYNQGHLPHALSFPLMTFDDDFPELLNLINRSSPVMVYCSSVACTDSHEFADRLKNMGYTDVKVFSGGFRLWQEKGYEIEKNEK